jgi:hypothetical protein
MNDAHRQHALTTACICQLHPAGSVSEGRAPPTTITAGCPAAAAATYKLKNPEQTSMLQPKPPSRTPSYKNTNRPEGACQLQLGRTCAGVNVMCSAPFTVLAMLAIVEMSPEHRKATADTAAI